MPLLFAVLSAICGLACLIYERICAGRLERLKQDGLCYTARIVNIIQAERPSPAIIRIGDYVDTVFVCLYTDEQGQHHEVSSRKLVYSGIPVEVFVYVDKNDPKKYVVEVIKEKVA